jgi:hypothetical protein
LQNFERLFYCITRNADRPQISLCFVGQSPYRSGVVAGASGYPPSRTGQSIARSRLRAEDPHRVGGRPAESVKRRAGGFRLFLELSANLGDELARGSPTRNRRDDEAHLGSP